MANAKKKGGFMEWYESYQGKKVTGMVYSLGASVVIIGALFKILHWPGANITLMIGMFTEAFLFGIGILDKPHQDFHWDNVFPQLLGYGTDPELLKEAEKRPRPTLLNANDMSLSTMDASAQMKNIESIANTTAALKAKMDAAAVAVDQYATEMAGAAKSAAEAEKASKKLAEQISDLNKIYGNMLSALE